MAKLQGKRIAILVTDGFEQSEMTDPRAALDAEGAKTTLIAPKAGKVKGWKDLDWGDTFDVDRVLADARESDYDALLLPGGVMNPDKLRLETHAIALVRSFFDAGKPVAAICHGPWLLIDAGVAQGRRLTSWPSIRIDLANAGARVEDSAVVVDRNLVTSRKPEDIPAFNRSMIEEFARGQRPPSVQAGRLVS